MSIATYGDLKTTLATYLNRSNLTSLIPTFIAMAENRMMYGDQNPQMPCQPLRIRGMETSADVAISAQTASLPTGWLQARRFYLNTNPVGELEYVTPELFWRTYISSDTAQPRRFTVEGENFVFGPIPDGSYTGKVLYYQKITALANDSDTNWVLTNAPGVYLHGSLAEAQSYVRNNAEAMKELSVYCGLVNALNLADKSDRYAGTSWQAFSDTGNP